VIASLGINPASSLPVTESVLSAGFVRSALQTVVRNADNTADLTDSAASFAQCNSAVLSPVAILQYRELLGDALRTRVVATPGANGQAIVEQNIPGRIYDSESGFVTSALGTLSTPLGLADYGTRLKASFTGVPPGVHLFVSTTNLTGGTDS